MTSAVAREYVTNRLLEEHFVCGPRFCAGWGDWFVIGGRWSGTLANISDADSEKRSSYDELGADDDAMPVTQELYDSFLKEYEGTHGVSHPEFIDLDESTVTSEFIGLKWVVVVDYHT